MKIKMKYIVVGLFSIILGACSSSMQMSKSSSYHGDDLYYNPTASYSEAQSQPIQDNSDDLKLTELEKRYSAILSNDSVVSSDTLIYKAESSNSSQSLLSDGYQDSYERRLRGRSNPYYGMSNISVYYSSDYWNAMAYDPYYYNVIVMGTDVWVEPYYVSSRFGWPHYNSYYSFGWGYSPYYYSPWRHSHAYHYGMNSWYSPWNSYAWGYNAGYWDASHNYYHGSNSNNHYYGRRPGQGNVSYKPIDGVGMANINQRQRDLSNRQVTLTNDAERQRVRVEGDGTIQGSVGQNTTREDSRTATRQRIEVREPARELSRKPDVVTRPTRENLNVNPTRVRPNEGSQDKPARDHNPTYTRPNPGNSNEFNRNTRRYPTTEAVRSNERVSGQQVAPPTRSTPRQPQRTFTPPPRTSTPTTQPVQRDRSSSGSSNVSKQPSTSGRSVSSPPANTSGSKSNSSNSNNSSNRNRR